jgi:hypothetical protein
MDGTRASLPGPIQSQAAKTLRAVAQEKEGCRTDFMPQTSQDYPAGRIQSLDTNNLTTGGPRYDAGYECELPPDVHTELVAPKRPRKLGPKRSATLNPAVTRPLYLTLLFAVMIVSGVALLWRQEQTAERAKTSKAILQPTPTPQPAPTSTAGPGGSQTSSANKSAARAVGSFLLTASL